MADPPKRVFYVDVIRAYAIFLVVVSHVFAPICWAMNDYPRSIWWVFNIANSVIRLCVPLFIMISGKLLLGSTRPQSYGQFIRRRFGKVVPAYFVWFMIYRYADVHLTGAELNVPRWIRDFLSGVTNNHLYFMYIILGLYLIAPLLKRFVQAASTKELRILLGLWLGHLTLQFIFPTVYSNSGGIATLVGYAGYFVLGYYLDREERFAGHTAALLGTAVMIVGINAFATFWLVVQNNGKMNERFYGGLTPLVVLYTACMFRALKNVDDAQIGAKWPTVRKCISYLSLDSYNVYLMHMLILYAFTNEWLGFRLSEDTGGSALIGVPLTSVAVLGSSLAISFLLQKIPVVSRFLVIPAS